MTDDNILVYRLYNLYELYFFHNYQWICIWHLWNFVLASFGTWANATQPKACKWFMEGLYPHQTSFSVMLKIALVGIQLWIYVATTIAFAYNLWSNYICCNMHRTLSTIVRFFILATPLCYGVYGVVICFTMPFSLQNAFKFIELYSPLPSHLVALIFFLVWLFTKALKTLSLSSTQI